MYAVYQLGIEPSSFHFEVLKVQNLQGWDKTREQVLDFEKLKSSYEEKLWNDNETTKFSK